jgi:hypothetical protein
MMSQTLGYEEPVVSFDIAIQTAAEDNGTLIVTETMVDEVSDQAHSMMDMTNPQELKTALSHFIEKIEVNDNEITIL